MFQHFLFKKNFKIITNILSHFSKKKYNWDIHYLAEIGSNLRIGHSSDIIIGRDGIIGDHVIIFNGVTIGANAVIVKEVKTDETIVGVH